MNDDELRARLARVDPTRGVAASTESPTAQEIRERVMETIEHDTTTPETVGAGRWRRPGIVAAAVASVAAIAIGAVVVAGGDGASPRQRDQAPTTLALSVPASGGGVSMNSCVMFDVNILAAMPVAFGGTVTAKTETSVTIDVDRWYKGGDADVVTISTPDPTTSAALDGVEFAEGSRYLVTATDGNVNGCGFSGPASADLEKAFNEAFPG